MTRCILMVLVAGLLVAAAPAPKEDEAKKEIERLQGTWHIVSWEHEGTQIEDAKSWTLSFEKDVFTLKRNGKFVAKGTFKVDPSQKPKAADVTYLEAEFDGYKGMESHAVYEIDGESLKWCTRPCKSDAVEKTRPKDFTTKEGDQRTLFILKKDKP